MRHWLSSLCILAVVGCEVEGKNTSDKKTSLAAPAAAMTVMSDDELPPCDASREGALIYVSSTKSFRVCADDQWTSIELKGEQGAQGEKGEQGVQGEGANETLNKAVDLYTTYRRGIFKTTLICEQTNPWPADCDNPDVVEPNERALLGSAFLCGDGVVCTNAHVLLCDDPQDATPCWQFVSFELQALEGSADTVNPDGTPVAPFFSTTSQAAFDYHSVKDLAKVTVTGVPADTPILPLATQPYTSVVTIFRPILSMSFPLGFQDLYTDIGEVNTPALGECDTSASISSGYGCPADFYDFSTTNDTDHGSSGSPLFDITTGDVIGVTTAGTEGENVNFTWATDASQYSDF